MSFLQPVSSYMSTDVITIGLDTPMTRAARLLDDQRISALPVVDDGALIGVISRTDLVHAGRIEPGRRRGERTLVVPNLPVTALIVHAPLTCTPATPLCDAAHAMVDARVHRLFVVDGGRPVGVISTLDLTAAIVDARVALPLEEVTRAPVATLPPTATLEVAVAALAGATTDVVIVHEHGPVGVFTPLDALVARDLPRDTPIEDVCERAFLALSGRMPLHHVAAQAAALDVWRVVATAGRAVTGVASGLELARLVAR